jgi:hypothetical protein
MRVLLILAAAFLIAPAATWRTASAGRELTANVSPSVVDVGLNFTGDDVHIYGAAPDATDLVVTVDGPAKSVKVNKKGKVLGLLWMTVDRAEVQNMPAFHLVRSSGELDSILTSDEQVRLGVDSTSASIMTQARAVDTSDEEPLPEAKAEEFIEGLHDTYVRDGRYVPCASGQNAGQEASAGHTEAATPSDHEVIALENGQWETWVSLPWDAPLGDYTVHSYSIEAGQVVASDTTTFTVKKVGLVDSLGSMAQHNGVVYGAVSLGIIIAVGLTIGFVFPKRRVSH